ncbi:MAG: hypothetical protein IKK43_03895 [Clostridia bacterium]|nr:hypothetical protein [Clostridia bacterium]
MFLIHLGCFVTWVVCLIIEWRDPWSDNGKTIVCDMIATIFFCFSFIGRTSHNPIPILLILCGSLVTFVVCYIPSIQLINYPFFDGYVKSGACVAAVFSFIVLILGISVDGHSPRSLSEISALSLDNRYELVSFETNEQTVVNGEISSIYILSTGGTSGNIKASTKTTYDYWYKREDGGMLKNTIDMSSYDYPQNVEIVVYYADTETPKVEFWRNDDAREEGDGETYLAKTEIRFTVPTGSVVDASFQRADSEMYEYSQMNGQ